MLVSWGTQPHLLTGNVSTGSSLHVSMARDHVSLMSRSLYFMLLHCVFTVLVSLSNWDWAHDTSTSEQTTLTHTLALVTSLSHSTPQYSVSQCDYTRWDTLYSPPLYLDYDDECAGWVSVDAGAGKVSSGDGQCCECSQLQQHQQWPVISLSTALITLLLIIIMIQCQLQHSGYWPSWSWELLSSSSPSLSWYQSTTSVSALLENYFSQVSTPLSTCSWCVPPPPLSIIHSSLPVSTHWRCSSSNAVSESLCCLCLGTMMLVWSFSSRPHQHQWQLQTPTTHYHWSL